MHGTPVLWQIGANIRGKLTLITQKLFLPGHHLRVFGLHVSLQHIVVQIFGVTVITLHTFVPVSEFDVILEPGIYIFDISSLVIYPFSTLKI